MAFFVSCLSLGARDVLPALAVEHNGVHPRVVDQTPLMGLQLDGEPDCKLRVRAHLSEAQFNRKRFGLKNHLSFDSRFPTLRKSLKKVGLDMSQNQNGISICFSR